jgi:hypothetical protein
MFYNYHNIHFQLRRVSDRNSIWKINFNSVYIGKIKLDNGNYFEDGPIWVIKDYNQQITLSSHLI